MKVVCFRGYRFLLREHEEDCRQLVHLALLTIGVDPFSPGEIDVAELNRTIQRLMYQAARELGYRAAKEKHHPEWKDVRHLDTQPRNWMAMWQAA